MDYARGKIFNGKYANLSCLAHSAYQKALNGMKDNFWVEPSGLYGIGLVYFHFRSYKA